MEIDGFEPREVYLVDYSFNQSTGSDGQIDGNPRGGRITVRVKAMNDGNNQLVQWMLEPDTARNVKLTFLNTTTGSTMKTIEGIQSYCINYTEKWEDKQMHFEEIELSCMTLKNGPVEFNNKWA